MSRPVLRLAVAVEHLFDAVRFAWRRRHGRIRPVIIHPYRGYATERAFHLTGRVLEDPGLGPSALDDTPFRNARAMARRFLSGEIPGVRVRAAFGAYERTVRTDGEGYFDVTLPVTEGLDPGSLWQDVALQLVDEVVPGQGPVRATGSVLAPPVEAGFAVVSDVDDTILKTGATSLLAMAQSTFLRNAHTRLPFEGVAAFYRALRHGPTGEGENPIFYVSSSPWNLYDFLVEFLDVHGIPHGPLFLRDLGLDRDKFIHSGHHDHKRAAIERLITAYPELPFVLVGDSGQEDPEIYRDIVRDHPGRVTAIYVRDVTDVARDAEVHAIAEEVRAHGADMRLVLDSVRAARHAADYGLIHPDALPDIEAERAKDAR